MATYQLPVNYSWKENSMTQDEYTVVMDYGTLEEVHRANLLMTSNDHNEEDIADLETLVSVCQEKKNKERWRE